MTESPGNEPGGMLFARVRQMVSERGVDIRLTPADHALRLEFADGQRILINFDAQSKNVWLAARSGGIEFVHRDGNWRAHDQTEFFARLRDTIEQTIAATPLNARPPVTRVQPLVIPQAVVYREAKQSHGVRNVLILMFAGLFGFWAALKMYAPHTPHGGSKDGQ